MTAPDGRRDNGLPAAEWGALVDVDPRLSEALLDSLAAEGVPAYVEPASDVDSYTRATTLPKRPLDRLWVDPARAELARAVVSSEVADLAALLSPEETATGLVRPVPRTAAARVLAPPELPTAPPAPSDDDVFAQIVAGFATDADEPVPRWPVSEDLSDEPPPAPAPRRTPPRDEDDDGLPAWVEPAALPDEGHFEPPPPPKVGRPRLRTLLATAMVLLGLTIVFVPTAVGLDDSSIWLLLGFLLTGGGAALLVAWLRDDDTWYGGPDDGAVV